MEDHNSQKEMDAFATKYIKEIELESPSKNFTVLLMKRIQTQDKVVFSSSKLISKKSWVVVGAIILGILFITSKSDEKSFIELPKINFSILTYGNVSQLFDFLSVSNITMIAFLFFGGMLIFQLFFLKNYFDKRFE